MSTAQLDSPFRPKRAPLHIRPCLAPFSHLPFSPWPVWHKAWPPPFPSKTSSSRLPPALLPLHPLGTFLPSAFGNLSRARRPPLGHLFRTPSKPRPGHVETHLGPFRDSWRPSWRHGAPSLICVRPNIYDGVPWACIPVCASSPTKHKVFCPKRRVQFNVF